MAVTLAAGCGELTEAEALSAQEAPMRRLDNCPSGECTNPTNGKGIYVAESAGYCIPVLSRKFFCPERFHNQSNGTVNLIGQLIDDTGVPVLPSEAVLQADGVWTDAGMETHASVTGITANSDGLVVSLSGGSAPPQASGQALLHLTIEFSWELQHLFTLRFHPSVKENDIALYQVQYLAAASHSWKSYCADGTGTAAFLPDMKVSDTNARIERVPTHAGVTMGCRTGAIATCMVWGYHPWGASAGEESRADFLYGACLQAKRAAYFIGSGDGNSYTVQGTPVAVQDNKGIMNVSMIGVEALWTPDGAVCLSPEFRRKSTQSADELPALPGALPIPPCDAALHLAASTGGLQALLGDEAPLATGRVEL
ncbi:ADYC domain-containing protein [Hyalangium sp.]|uniref:ADYC domain-containing protein n=1 Tax=Hyalangium sp. TaxID=2028555 RepID=UPI002D76F0A4|nr:ADYC domain-containing protein [Hyalangium sp.]